MKKCSHCKVVKPIDQFNKHAGYADGHQLYCRECQRVSSQISSKKHLVSKREKLKAWRKANPEKRRAQKRRHYARNPEPAKRRERQRRKDNPERANQQSYKWSKNNPDKRNAIVRKSYHAHIETRREKGVLAQRKRRNLPGSHTDTEWEMLCEKYGWVCLCCKKPKKLHQDHIIPVGEPDCTDYIDNIQPLCASCNASKGHRTIDYR